MFTEKSNHWYSAFVKWSCQALSSGPATLIFQLRKAILGRVFLNIKPKINWKHRSIIFKRQKHIQGNLHQLWDSPCCGRLSHADMPSSNLPHSHFQIPSGSFERLWSNPRLPYVAGIFAIGPDLSSESSARLSMCVCMCMCLSESIRAYGCVSGEGVIWG